MTDIANIDRNFEVKSAIDKADISFFSVDEEPFRIYGVFKENGKYRRMPEKVAKNVSQGVYSLHTNTSGGRVKFITDSNYIAIYAMMEGVLKAPHFSFTGSIGFDLYVGEEHVKTFVPPLDVDDHYESVAEFETKELRDVTIHFPLYSNVKELRIGLQKDSIVEKAFAYSVKKPVVYYGSSITQGGCASRPGMSYPAMISRKFDCDYLNLGFAGNAMGEEVIADYIKNLDMSIFVYDYDNNSPTPEFLLKTHERMFQIIRKSNPDLPIIMMTRPKISLTEGEEERLQIIRNTYQNAILSGDNNVYILDGEKLTDVCKYDGTVDNTHPNDFGFFSMAKALGDLIENHHLLQIK